MSTSSHTVNAELLEILFFCFIHPPNLQRMRVNEIVCMCERDERREWMRGENSQNEFEDRKSFLYDK